jgi:hypothetical protein
MASTCVRYSSFERRKTKKKKNVKEMAVENYLNGFVGFYLVLEN